MKILLDECVNGRLARDLPGHDVWTIGRMRWKGLSNGRLLQSALDAGFEGFITVDSNISFQQDVSKYALTVYVLRVRHLRLAELRLLAPALLAALASPAPGNFVVIDSRHSQP